MRQLKAPIKKHRDNCANNRPHTFLDWYDHSNWAENSGI